MALTVRTSLTLISSCLALALAQSASAGPEDDARLKGLAWLIKNQRGDGSWRSASGIEVPVTGTALSALHAAKISGYPRAAAVSWLVNAPTYSADALARKSMGLRAAGVSVTPFMVQLVALRNSQFTWGTYSKHGHSHIDTALSVSAIKDAAYNYTNYATAICVFATTQSSADGGWSYMVPLAASATNTQQTTAVIPTVHVLAAVAALKSSITSVNCGTPTATTYSLQTILDQGLNGLIATKKRADGSFGDGTTGTVLETALVYGLLRVHRAADAATTTAQSYLLSQQITAAGTGFGSWNNDPYLTSQVLRAIPPLTTALTDTDADGVPNSVETLIGTDPNVHDSRYLARGNGQGVDGVHVPVTLPTARRNVAYGYTLPGSGTSPYTWRLAGGALPSGLALTSSTGQISGTPTVLGAFSFTYEVVDATAAIKSTLAQIPVTENAVASPTSIAEWSVISTRESGTSEVEASRLETLNLLGTRAQRHTAMMAAESLMAPWLPIKRYMVNDSSGAMIQEALEGTVSQANSDLDGARLRIVYRITESATDAMQAVAAATSFEFYELKSCTDSDGDNHWLCAKTARKDRVDAGLMDVPLAYALSLSDTGETTKALSNKLAALAWPTTTWGFAAPYGYPKVNLARTEALKLLQSQQQRPTSTCQRAQSLPANWAIGIGLRGADCDVGGSQLANALSKHRATAENNLACTDGLAGNDTNSPMLMPLGSESTFGDRWYWLALDHVLPTADSISQQKYGWHIPGSLYAQKVSAESSGRDRKVELLDLLSARAVELAGVSVADKETQAQISDLEACKVESVVERN